MAEQPEWAARNFRMGAWAGVSAIRVLVVDDSLLMRRVLGDLLGSAAGIEVVGYARDGVEALAMITTLTPQVITLDIEMPRMDGLACLAKIMELHPTPVVMVSSWTTEGAELTLKALELGAVDFVAKPSGDESDSASIGAELVGKVRLAATIDPARLTSGRIRKVRTAAFSPRNCGLVVIGASTGGPRALQVLLQTIPAPFPAPIVIAQHIPAGFTEALAQRLDSITPLTVKEGASGETLLSGHVYVCPAGLQSTVRHDAGKLWLECGHVSGQVYKPSIDILFQSAAEACGERTAAVLLTGMGSDGARGMLAIRQAGGVTLAEDEATCVVFGMPRSAAELGAAQQVLPLYDLAEGLLTALARREGVSRGH